MNTKTEANSQAGAGQVERRVRPTPGRAEAEALRALANHAKFEAAMKAACDGSMLAQKAACLEWLACGAEYRETLLHGAPRGGDLLAAEQQMVRQIGYLAKNWA